MANKYLEKIALLDLATGYVASDKGDKLGGAISGGLLGFPAGRILTKSHGLVGAVAGAIGGGYLGAKAYGAAKNSFRTPAQREAHIKLNKKK